ncbi:site-specific recombinase XerD [Luteimonas cucumeris]|uniref:Site-specific recombinase XerD n=1 Tax=Luteimonas cucumeris TaxID=985012 RepID=A0A562LB04_9GAMM|nr:site-specific integrase [Luteimonas cucumeris]TWI04859.1 site-specific recombinase XerD [Luteimonas cucumeris]
MASIQRNGSKWRAQVYVQGVRDSDTFQTRQEASRWALEREAELSGRKLPDKTYGDAMRRYVREVTPDRGGARWEEIRLTAMEKYPIANRRMEALVGNDFADWRDDRLKQVKPGTVAREMNLLRSVLEVARRDWHWIRVNPMKDVRWPETPKGRARRLSETEVNDLAAALGVGGKLKAVTQTQRVGLMFLFALETAMRSGEMVAMRWENVHTAARYVHLPKTKNGDARDVPLSKRALAILKVLPEGDGPVFGLDDASRDALWRKMRPEKHRAIHFHDTRAEAIWRLSKKLDVMQLALVIGHRDLKSLMIYYNESASDMARRLG